MDAGGNAAYVLRPGEGRLIDLGAFRMSVLATGEQTNGAFSLLEADEPAGFGPPLHIHRDAAEAFYVLEREYVIFLDDREFVCPAGSFIFIPAGLAHGFRVGAAASNETRKPAPWRSNPPVSDELWARVDDVRRSKTRAGGPKRADRVDLLKGLIECVCGRRVRSDGTFADGRHRKLHADPCADWGKRARLGDDVWEEPILAQLEGIELDDGTIAAVVASLGSAPRPVALDRARIERQIRELALEHAAGRLEDAVYLDRLHELRDAKENLKRTTADGISPERAVAWLQALSATWRAAEVPAEKADLLHAIYDRIVVAGRSIVSVRLTPSAYAHGFALALPEKVAVARPTGVGRALATYEIPIEGRDEWLAAARRLA